MRARQAVTPAIEPEVASPVASAGLLGGIALVTVTVTTFLVVTWHVAPVRSGLERLDRHITPALYLGLGLLVVLSWTSWGRRGFPVPAFHRAPRGMSGPVGLTASVIAFSVPVFAGWQRGHVYSMIAGVVPWGDAHLYAGGAQRLLFFDDLDAYNSRRPFTAMFLAVRLAVTGLDLRLAALLGAFVVGTAVFLAARAVARDLGPLSGLALFVGVYGFTRYYVPATVSETLGVVFGALAFATVWAAFRTRSVLLAVGGVFLLGLALDVRSGVFLLPFFMAVLLARHLRAVGAINLRVLGASALAVVLAMGLNFGVVASLGGDTGNVFGTSGLLIYGMARGHASWDPVDVSWFQVYTDHPEIIQMTDGERNRFVNSLAREEVVAHPGRFLRATVSSYGNYLRLAKQSILGPWSVGLHRPLMLIASVAIAAAIATRARRGRHDRVRRWRWSDLALFAGVVVAIPPLVISLTPYLLAPDWLPALIVATAFVAFLVVGSRPLLVPFPVPVALVGMLAVLLSLPFIGSDSIRLFADGIAILSLPLALAVAALTRPPRPLDSDDQPPPSPVGERRPSTGALPLTVGAGLLASLLVGTPVAMAAVDRPEVEARTCPDGRAAEALIGGVAVKLVTDPVGSGRPVDQLGLAAFAREALNFYPVPYGHLVAVTGPTTVIGGISPEGVDRFAFLDGDVQPPGASVRYMCGHVQHDPLTDYFFTFAPNPADVFRGREFDR